jgi:hypothetical protein
MVQSYRKHTDTIDTLRFANPWRTPAVDKTYKRVRDQSGAQPWPCTKVDVLHITNFDIVASFKLLNEITNIIEGFIALQ